MNIFVRNEKGSSIKHKQLMMNSSRGSFITRKKRLNLAPFTLCHSAAMVNDGSVSSASTLLMRCLSASASCC